MLKIKARQRVITLALTVKLPRRLSWLAEVVSPNIDPSTIEHVTVPYYDFESDPLGKRVSKANMHAREIGDPGRLTVVDLWILWHLQGRQCAYTGKPSGLKKVTLDHIVPLSRGGMNTIDNVIFCSYGANNRKGSLSLKAWCKAEDRDYPAIQQHITRVHYAYQQRLFTIHKPASAAAGE